MGIESIVIGQIVWCKRFVKSAGGRAVVKNGYFEVVEARRELPYRVVGIKSPRRKSVQSVIVVLKRHIKSRMRCAKYADVIWRKES